MALTFPSNPTDGQEVVLGTLTFSFNSTTGKWTRIVRGSGTVNTDISQLTDTTSIIPSDISDLTDTGGLLSAGGPGTNVYATLDQLPRSGVTTGQTALVTAENRFYIWNGIGWFSVAVFNAAPTITNAPSATYNLSADGAPTIITLAATDSDGDSLTWSFSAPSASGKATVTQADNVFTITPETNIADTSFTIDFEVTDGINIATASSTVNITNAAPIIDSGVSGTIALASDGTPTILTLSASDPEGQSITWSFSDSGLTDQATVTQDGNEFTITPNSTPAAYADFTLTFTASDSIESTSTDATTFSLTFILVADAWSDTVLSIGTSSTDGLDNSTFIDRSTNGSTVTPSALPPVQTAFHPYLDNWSVEFDGSGDYLRCDSPVQNAPNNDSPITIECLINAKTSGSNICVFSLNRFNDGNSQLSLFLDKVIFYGSSFSLNTSIDTNTWVHVAVVYSGTDLKVYTNGILNTTFSGTLYNPPEDLLISIGCDLDFSTLGPRYYFNGHISNLRIVNGDDLYTANFIPPTEKLTAVFGTSLLTCQSNRFIDNSTNAHTITANGDAKVSAFNPFGQDSEYAAGENKGSVDLNGDYLSLSSSDVGNFGTGDYTVQFWIYKRGTTNDCILDLRGGDFGHGVSVEMDTKVTVFYGGSPFQDTGSFANYAWNHIAICRSSAVLKGFINGEQIFSVADTNNRNNTNNTSKIGVNYSNAQPTDALLSDIKVTHTAEYTSAFTPPVSPLGNTNAKLYLPMDNAGIFDKTGNNLIDLTTTGLSSTSITKYSNSSLRTSGSGYVTAELPFELGLADFTIEWWQRTDSDTGDSMLTLGVSTASGGQETGWAFGFTPTVYRFWSGQSYSFTGGSVTPATFTGGVWNHIAICRENGVYYGYINGNYFGSLSGLSSFSLTASDIKIGGYISSNLSFSRYPPGNVENLQLVLGRKYTTNFTPPTQEQGRTYQQTS